MPAPIIRPATRSDGPAIEQIHLAAFSPDEGPRVARLALELLNDDHQQAGCLTLVAERNDVIVGHVAFSPVTVGATPAQRGFILAPLAVHPDHQARGIGAALTADGGARIGALGGTMLLVYGDPAYYGRFGFNADDAVTWVPPYPLEYPLGWLGRVLDAGAVLSAPTPIRCVPALRDPDLW